MASGSREKKAVETLRIAGIIPRSEKIPTAARTSEIATAKSDAAERQVRATGTNLITRSTHQPRCVRHLWNPTPSRTLPAQQAPGKLSGKYKPFNLKPDRLTGGYEHNEARIAREKVLLKSRRSGSKQGFQTAKQALRTMKQGEKRAPSASLNSTLKAPPSKQTKSKSRQPSDNMRQMAYAETFHGKGLTEIQEEQQTTDTPTKIKGTKHPNDHRDDPFDLQGAHAFLVHQFARHNVGGVVATYKEK